MSRPKIASINRRNGQMAHVSSYVSAAADAIKGKCKKNLRSHRLEVLSFFPLAVCEKITPSRFRVTFHHVGTPIVFGDSENHAWSMALRWCNTDRPKSANSKPNRRISTQRFL